MKENEYKVGDIVPYKNTRGNIKLAKIISFKYRYYAYNLEQSMETT